MGHTMTEEEREDLEKTMIRSSKYIAPKLKRAIYFLKNLLLFIIAGMGGLIYYTFIFIIYSIIEFTRYFSCLFTKSKHVETITNEMQTNADNFFGIQGVEFREYFIAK